jgi:DNA-binding NarL/FixJ family response regulator
MMAVAKAPFSVFLLAPNRLLREALARILDKKTGMTVAGACAFSPDALEEMTSAMPDVLVMDGYTSTSSQLQFMRDVRQELEGLKIVMIGMERHEQKFLQAIREGALGYLLRDASSLEIVSAIRAVAGGEAVCPPELSLSVFRYIARQGQQVPNFYVKVALGLTGREQQLMTMIGRGLTNKEIARQLQLAEQTVRNHVHRMLRKVGADNRLAAVEVCRMQGLAV